MAGRPLRSLRARSNPSSQQWANAKEFMASLTPADKKNIAELTYRFQKDFERENEIGESDTPDYYAFAILLAMYSNQPFRTYRDLAHTAFEWYESDRSLADYYDLQLFAHREIHPLYPGNKDDWAPEPTHMYKVDGSYEDRQLN